MAVPLPEVGHHLVVVPRRLAAVRPAACPAGFLVQRLIFRNLASPV